MAIMPDTLNRTFKPPTNIAPSHTGTMWRNKDGSVGIVITDVFNTPIRLIGIKEGDGYYVRGWRGDPPEFIRLPLVDDKPHEDGLPSQPCAKCEGRLFWREAVALGGSPRWCCAKCELYDPAKWLDGCVVPERKVKTLKKEGSLL